MAPLLSHRRSRAAAVVGAGILVVAAVCLSSAGSKHVSDAFGRMVSRHTRSELISLNSPCGSGMVLVSGGGCGQVIGGADYISQINQLEDEVSKG